MALQREHPISVGLSRRLGDLLVEKGIITDSQLAEVLALQRQSGGKLGSLLVQKGYIEEEVLLSFLSKQCGISYVILSERGPIGEDVLKCVPEALARRHTLVPIERTGNTLSVAVADPLNVLVLDDLKMMTGYEIRPALASEGDINAAIEKAYGKQSSQEVLDEILQKTGAKEGEAQVDVVEEKEDKGGGVDIVSMKGTGDEGPIIQMVNLILAQAIRAKASDIHIEPYQKTLRVRYRIDGVLHEQPAPPKKFLNAIVSRLKVMSNLDISEHRLPQDGRIKINMDGKEIDLRVSILPCAPGEKICMRILDSSGLKVRISDLGFEPENLASFEKGIKHPHGIILITGPTGSGKSTTLYSALATLNDPDTNIVTIEDPVEYQLPGINQVSVNNEVGLNFARGLKAFLRQDPDIIMVGEIRDTETMGIAINAAMTGHLVLSTLHTNDAPGAITRITMMGIEPFLISSTVTLVVAQRLVRRVCSQCRETYEVEAQWLAKLGVRPDMFDASGGKVQLYRGKGCDNCAKTGYRGRAGIHEMLELNDDVREMVMNRGNSTQIKEVARKHGMMTLRESAIRKMLQGITTVEEMLRVTASDVD